MAFVYCQQRWHLGKENTSPGPAEYSAEYCIAENHQRGNYQLKRAKSPPRIKQTFTSSTNILLKQSEETVVSQSAKKGKLHRNHSNIVRGCKENEGEKIELKVTIKNAMHTLAGNTSSRNKWGNMRIKEMLNEHRQKELKKQFDQLHKRHNSRDILCENQQKAHEGLKQIQGLFLSQRKGSNPNMVKKSNLSKKQARHFSYNQLRVSEISKEQLQVEPTIVYAIENNNSQVNKSKESSIIRVSPICSLGESKAVLDYSIPTGIQGDQEDSIQYISEATPGPGSYNPYLPQSKISTNIEKFGVTMERFSCNRRKQLQAQTPITPHQPAYRVSSKANQQKVGFGRSKKQRYFENIPNHNGVFYEDFNSLQRQAKMLLLNKNSKIGFGSCKERFQENNSINEQQKYQPVQQEQEQDFEQQKPTCVFLSKVNRQIYNQKPQVGGQFFAQNVFCLANKIKNSKNRIEEYDLKPAPFLSNSNRFSSKPIFVKEDKSPKNSLDQQFLPRENKKINIIEQPAKGFSFGKQQRKEIIQRNSPSPGEYQSTSQWIKASYNIRFT